MAIQRSADSCYLLFSHPQSGLTLSLSEETFVSAATWRMEQLGLDVDTLRMMVIYPKEKRGEDNGGNDSRGDVGADQAAEGRLRVDAR